MKHFCHSLDYTAECGNSPPPPQPHPHFIKKGQVCIMTLHHSISSNITQQIKLTAGKSLFDCWSLQKDSLCYYRWWCKASCPQMSVDILGTSCDQCLTGGGDSSVVRAPDSWLKGRGFESLLERRENFILQGRLSVLTLISVSVPPPCYHSST